MVNGKRRFEHDVIWEKANNMPIPKGCVIHHSDGNGRNNSIENLVMMTAGEHVRLHSEMRRKGTDPVDSNDPAVMEYREKSRSRQKKRYLLHKEELREKRREYCRNNKDKISEYNKEYNASHREEIKKHHKEYREKNADKLKEYEKKRYSENKEFFKEKTRRYHAENKEKDKAYAKQYYQNRKDDLIEYSRQWRLKNPDKVKAQSAAYVESHRELLKAKDKLRYAIEKGFPQDEIERRRRTVEIEKQKLNSGN